VLVSDHDEMAMKSAAASLVHARTLLSGSSFKTTSRFAVFLNRRHSRYAPNYDGYLFIILSEFVPEPYCCFRQDRDGRMENKAAFNCPKVSPMRIAAVSDESGEGKVRIENSTARCR